MHWPRVLLGAALAVTTACSRAGDPVPITPSRGDMKTVSAEDLASAVHMNLYDYLVAERPRWLRGSQTSLGAQQVIVFLGETRLGGIQTLKNLSTNTVLAARYFEASAAQQRFNGKDLGPVIQVISK
jgi:hypothetical protein